MDIKVSVIIPIYNVEKYLSRCLDSILSQTHSNLEIICVNDCSPDNSLSILNKYTQKDKRIKIINRENNGGLSATRNVGIKVATGEYICFVDSDDWIDSDYIEKMITKAHKYSSSIVVNTNIIMDYSNKPSENLFFGNLKIDSNGEEILSCKAMNNIMWSAWSHLYKRSFIIQNNILFPENYIYEDMYFTPAAYSHVEKIYAFKGARYHYCIREDSICRQEKDENAKKIKLLSIFNMVFDYLKNSNYIDTHSCLLYPSNFIILNYNQSSKYIFKYIREYFIRIEKYVKRDKDLYNPIEFEFFEDVLSNSNNIKTTNYLQRLLLQKLRQNIRSNHA